jgi:hypothetical protein
MGVLPKRSFQEPDEVIDLRSRGHLDDVCSMFSLTSLVVSPHNDRGRVRSLRKSLNFRSPVILSTFEDMVNTNIKIQISIGSCSSEDC